MPSAKTSAASSSEGAPTEEPLPGLPPTVIPGDDDKLEKLREYRESKDGESLRDWAESEYTRCKNAKTQKQEQWYTNLAYVLGQQWLTKATGGAATGKLQPQQAPRWQRRKTINLIRRFVRTEQSKFLSTLPNIVAVPATAEDEDVRSAYAAEQVWMSYSETKRFRRQYSAAIWWAIVTGTGFIKTWWDPAHEVKMPGGGVDKGDVEFRKVTPFHIFVPELREREIDDQPYIIEARVRPLSWVKTFYAEQLKDSKGKDVGLSGTTSAANTIMDEGYLGLTKSQSSLDSVIVKEFWVRPGSTKLLPDGGFFVMVEDVIVDHYEGLPYTHGELPYTKFEHLFNDTFWADSPIVDLIQLQKEYNEVRTDISVAARRMGNPQLLAAQGSIVPGKMTNEPGSVITYRPGLPPPGPAPLAQLPQYVVEQLDRVRVDFDDISGQHEVSKGQAPAGVTAGTALAYLGERDDNFLTPQYQGVEDGMERVAKHVLMLFQQFVDIERKIKVVGLDGAMDTMLLSGADIENGTDVRVEPGTGIGQSQAAKQQQVYDLVSLGIVGPDQALKMLEIGGPQKVLDIVNAAERKAQRENMKMKALKDKPDEIELANQEFMANALEGAGPMDEEQLGLALAYLQENLPPVVEVDDFDLHEVHIETHNRFRMSQEYETLPEPVKDQFERHVAWHQQMGGQQMQMQLEAQMPPEVMAQDEAAAGGPPPGGAPEGEMQPPSGSMSPVADPAM